MSDPFGTRKRNKQKIAKNDEMKYLNKDITYVPTYYFGIFKKVIERLTCIIVVSHLLTYLKTYFKILDSHSNYHTV